MQILNLVYQNSQNRAQSRGPALGLTQVSTWIVRDASIASGLPLLVSVESPVCTQTVTAERVDNTDSVSLFNYTQAK